jgi:caffeoyl-CoA O-methyltransferase
MRVTSPQQKYLNEVFGLPDADLAQVRVRMTAAEREAISISSAEARILQFLIRGFGIKKIVEFGTLFGYSALAMSKVLPADGQIITLEKDEATHKFAAETFANIANIRSLCGDALELMTTIRGPVDMVFIDANKSGYIDYLNWAEKNVRSGGLIVGDNTFLWGGVWGVEHPAASVMIEFNRRLADPAKYNSILIPTAEGMTVAQKL